MKHILAVYDVDPVYAARFASPSPGRKLRIKSTRERTPSAPIKVFSSWIREFCFIL